jgi:hypothetical protein
MRRKGMAITNRIASNRTMTPDLALDVNHSALIAAAGYGCVYVTYTTLLNRKNSAKRLGIRLKEGKIAARKLAAVAGS